MAATGCTYGTANIMKPYYRQKKGIFEAKRCESCGELTFAGKLRLATGGKLVCIPCSGYGA